jgi:hypothetical protein
VGGSAEGARGTAAAERGPLGHIRAQLLSRQSQDGGAAIRGAAGGGQQNSLRGAMPRSCGRRRVKRCIDASAELRWVGWVGGGGDFRLSKQVGLAPHPTPPRPGLGLGVITAGQPQPTTRCRGTGMERGGAQWIAGCGPDVAGCGRVAGFGLQRKGVGRLPAGSGRDPPEPGDCRPVEQAERPFCPDGATGTGRAEPNPTGPNRTEPNQPGSTPTTRIHISWPIAARGICVFPVEVVRGQSRRSRSNAAYQAVLI